MSEYPDPPLLSTNTESDEALEFLSAKYRVCLEKHPECKPRGSGQEWLPRRLIDVGGMHDDVVRLVDSHDIPIRGPYFTLSHCWGDYQPITLTQKSASSLQAGHLARDLPKTYQDAVIVTRRFGVRYLWIDSLCIFQDNIEDWSLEARQMTEIYSRAACGIAATAAKDSSIGLFFDRDPVLLRPAICDLYRDRHRTVEDTPLSSRAWVAQERHLSSRIMHFGKDQLFWECNSEVACEVYRQGFPDAKMLVRPERDPNTLKKLMSLGRHPFQTEISGTSTLYEVLNKNFAFVDQLYNAWDHYRDSYTTYKLTREEDKLVALYGVAQAVAKVLNDELVAGLWRNRILEGLCWRRDYRDRTRRVLSQWRAPSWSWASTDSKVLSGSFFSYYHQLPIGELLVSLRDLEVETKLSGQLQSAAIWLECRPIAMRIQGSSFRRMTFASGEVFDFTAKDALRMLFDDPEHGRNPDSPGNMYLLCIRYFPRCRELPEGFSFFGPFIEGLILEPFDLASNIFKRVGHFDFAGKDMWTILKQHQATHSCVIKII